MIWLFLDLDSHGNIVTQHVRDLVKECIEHAKLTNEASVKDGKSHSVDASVDKKTFLQDVTQKQQQEKGVQAENLQVSYNQFPFEFIHNNRNRDRES